MAMRVRAGHGDVPMSTFGDRLKQLRKHEPQRAVAERLGIPQTTLSNYEKNKNQPDFALIEKICREFKVTSDWLLFGIMPAAQATGLPAEVAEGIARSWAPPVFVSQPVGDDPWKNAQWQEVPVIGLANCGDKDWYTPGKMALRIPLPVNHPYNPDLFAVLAVGTSMQPEGIRQGFVLFCDPAASIDPGDAVYIEKRDGTASVKKFLKRDEHTLHVQGWAEPKADGSQQAYFEEIPAGQVSRIVCVVIVKRKG